MTLRPNPIRLALAALLLAALGGVAWRAATGWAPSRSDYPSQGVVVPAGAHPSWHVLGATGVDFAYIEATLGGRVLPGWAEQSARAAKNGIRHGAIIGYSPCSPASGQAAAFVTSVARAPGLLPPAIRLDWPAGCTARPDRALILSELATLLAQVEGHSGKPALLLVTPAFEQAYAISAAIDRTVWVEGDWLAPDYAARPFVMWTANHARRLRGSDRPLPWVVVQP